MKKIIALTSLIFATTAFAQFNDGSQPHLQREGKAHHQMKQGFFDEATAVKTVEAAKQAQDDAPMMIEGKIVKQIGKNDYVFQDATGEIEIEVSKRAWNGQQVSPSDTIVIYGKVDKEWNKTELDVKRIEKK